ncbi:MAG: gutB [Deltaproteobacteria bacterium]|nr:gutB [Deltaproteobacteria bacterium]
MRVARYYSNKDVRLEEKPVPKIGPGEILMKVHASGICGSDVMEWYRIHKVPLVLGHEVSGEVVEVGEGVTEYKKGDRICAAHHVSCNTCHYCLSGHHTVCETLRKTNFEPGGFSEYIRLPAINVDRGVFLLPDEVSYEDATFIEPLACILRGQRQARFQPGQSVLVIGSGIAGLLHIQLAKALGAGRIMATDISEYRMKAALKLGADAVIDAKDDVPARAREINNNRLADVVILCAGATTAIEHGLKSVERCGSVLFFAPTDKGVTIPFSVNDTFWRNEITLTSSYAGSTADHTTALELIRARRVDVNAMITHRLGLADTGKGFQMVVDAKDSLKVIIEPQK